MTRHYYAMYNPRGNEFVWNGMNWPKPFVFQTAAERDAFVAEDPLYNEAVPERLARKYRVRTYDSNDTRAYYVTEANEHTYEDEGQHLIPTEALAQW